MIRFLILLAVAAFVIATLAQSARRALRSPLLRALASLFVVADEQRRPGGGGPPASQVVLVRCDECGTHVPASETVSVRSHGSGPSQLCRRCSQPGTTS